MTKKLADREQFERWCARAGFDITRFRDCPDEYLSERTEFAWRGYQAALRSERRRGKR